MIIFISPDIGFAYDRNIGIEQSSKAASDAVASARHAFQHLVLDSNPNPPPFPTHLLSIHIEHAASHAPI